MLACYPRFVVSGYKAASFGVPSLHLSGHPFGDPLGKGKENKNALVQPQRRVAEIVLAPYTDEEATHMLRGATDSWAFLSEYERLRGEGMGVEQAITSWGTSSVRGTPGTNPWAS